MNERHRLADGTLVTVEPLPERYGVSPLREFYRWWCIRQATLAAMGLMPLDVLATEPELDEPVIVEAKSSSL